jgi:hypothetical protein
MIFHAVHADLSVVSEACKSHRSEDHVVPAGDTCRESRDV